MYSIEIDPDRPAMASKSDVLLTVVLLSDGFCIYIFMYMTSYTMCEKQQSVTVFPSLFVLPRFREAKLPQFAGADDGVGGGGVVETAA